MSENGVQAGSVSRVGDIFEARLERLFDHDRDAVWHMITQPDALMQWLAPGSIELRAGGAVHIDFADSGIVIESTVLELDPLKLLGYSWSSGNEPARPLRWELESIEEGTRMVLLLRLPVTEDVAKACAGFDAHLEMLAAALEGVPIHFPVNYYLERRDVYQELRPD